MSVLSVIGAAVVLLLLWFAAIFFIDTKGSDMIGKQTVPILIGFVAVGAVLFLLAVIM